MKREKNDNSFARDVWEVVWPMLVGIALGLSVLGLMYLGSKIF